MTGDWRSRQHVLAVNASCAAILIGFAAFATAQVPPSAAEQQQLAALRQQVSALEKRVTELEKPKGSVARADESAQTAKEGAGTKALEQRLAALEQVQATKESVLGPDKATVVTAPFVVVDRAGKAIMRVQGEATEKASRGIYVYSAASDAPLAHMGITTDGVGRIYAKNAASKRPQVQMLGPSGGAPALVLVLRDDGEGFNSLEQQGLLLRDDGEGFNSLEQQGLLIRNGDGKPIGSITSQSGTGYLALSDNSGNTMVDAGTLKSQKGYVRVNPYRASTSPQGDPSVLIGGKR